MECIKNIIGISETECDCFIPDLNAGQPEGWYMVSDSGLFLDQLEGIVSLRQVKGSASCNRKIGSIYAEASRNGLKYVVDDFIKGIYEKYKPERGAFKGRVGGKAFNKNLILNKRYAGARLIVSRIPDGFVKIKGIGTIFDRKGSVSVIILKRYQDYDTYEQIGDPIILNTSPGRHEDNLFEEPIILPAYDGEAQTINYYFLYEIGEINPKDNNNSCGCGKKEIEWRKYGNITGIIGEDLNKLRNFTVSSKMNGLTFDLEAGCDVTGLICSMYPNNQAFSTVLAHAVRYREAMIVQRAVADSDEITRESMLNIQSIGRTYNIFQAEYYKRAQWLIDHVDLSENGCFSCVDRRLGKSGILA